MTISRSQFPVSVLDGVAFLRMVGDVDLASADQLRDAAEFALTNHVGTLRIDLSEVTFLDSAGLGALITIRNQAREIGIELVLDQPSERARRVMDITGLTKVFTIHSAS
jgi:anti-anti-sigma factor